MPPTLTIFLLSLNQRNTIVDGLLCSLLEFVVFAFERDEVLVVCHGLLVLGVARILNRNVQLINSLQLCQHELTLLGKHGVL